MKKYKSIKDFSGYGKIPPQPKPYDRWEMTKKELEEYHRICRIEEQFYNMISGVLHGTRKCKIYTDKYVIRYVDKHGIDSLYRDFSFNYTKAEGYRFFSAFLPFGLKQIDSSFGKQIRILGEPECLFTAEELGECILRQPNLHPMIRNNLYSNFLNYKKNVYC